MSPVLALSCFRGAAQRPDGPLEMQLARPGLGDHAVRFGRRLALGHYLNIRIVGNKFAQAVTGERLRVNYGKTNWHCNFPPKGRFPPTFG